MSTAMNIFEKTAAAHVFYCKRIERTYADRAWKPFPRAHFFVGKPAQRLRGQFNEKKHLCRYNICYALTESDFEITIAHEICHAYQRQIYLAAQWHGELFHYLLREVCGFTESGTHGKGGRNRYMARQFYQILMYQGLRSTYDNVEIPLSNIRSAVAAEKAV